MRRESPIKRRYASGRVVWVARYTGRDGKRHIAKPGWNRDKGTFARRADAQRAIQEAYGISDKPDTLGEYFASWTDRHPRSERTNATNRHRISASPASRSRGSLSRTGRCAICEGATPMSWSITC